MANEQSVWNLLEITLAIFPAHVDAGIAMLFPMLERNRCARFVHAEDFEGKK
jgi:hypothetical protein